MKCADMIDNMKFQHQYVPAVEYEERTRCDEISDVIVKDAVMYPLLFGGDQLSVARQRTALKVMSNAETPALRMEGLIPTIEDWHTKLTFLEVRFVFTL